MRYRLGILVVSSAFVSTSCSLTPAEAPGDLMGPAATSQRALTVPAAPSTSNENLCGFDPPPILTPANGAVVSGSVTLSAPLLEGPCFITASVVFKVRNAQGTVVREGCDFDLPAHISWDTTGVKDGPYTVSAQRACSCNACAEASYVSVTVTNPG